MFKHSEAMAPSLGAVDEVGIPVGWLAGTRDSAPNSPGPVGDPAGSIDEIAFLDQLRGFYHPARKLLLELQPDMGTPEAGDVWAPRWGPLPSPPPTGPPLTGRALPTLPTPRTRRATSTIVPPPWEGEPLPRFEDPDEPAYPDGIPEPVSPGEPIGSVSTGADFAIGGSSSSVAPVAMPSVAPENPRVERRRVVHRAAYAVFLGAV